MILRGGRKLTNSTPRPWRQPASSCEKAGLPARVMIDCSPREQQQGLYAPAAVCRDVAAQIAAGDRRIIGVMIESNLVAGAQKLMKGKPLVYGQSITDACIGWPETLDTLRELAAAVSAARLPAVTPTAR